MKKESRIALYGLGVETGRAIALLDGRYDIVGLLDGLQTEGELYGKHIISIDQAIDAGIEKIIVVARPGSCKAIAKRIGDKCKDSEVGLYDIRGLDLLESEKEIYEVSRMLDVIDSSRCKGRTSFSDVVKSEIFRERLEQITDAERVAIIHDAYDIGYLFCAPLITDFVLWLYKQLLEKSIQNIWFSARDGFLIRKLFKIMDPAFETTYFLTSRSAAIRAGVMNEEDIKYVDSMKFSGTLSENAKVRFGLEVDGIKEDAQDLLELSNAILSKADKSRQGYRAYINTINIKPGDIALFDFVAKGTIQYFIGKIIPNHIKGFYFLQLEPEFMKDKHLDIVPFYSGSELVGSAIFDNYYILETILTSPEPSAIDFDLCGNPVYAVETRTQKDIDCLGRVQSGIIDYFRLFLERCPVEKRIINKKYDEEFLKMIHNIEIQSNDFTSLVVEDPFFNRMTDITDVL